MKIDDLLNTEERIVLIESKNSIIKALSSIQRMPWEKAKNILRSSLEEFVEFVEDKDIEDEVVSIINKGLGTNFRDIRDALMLRVIERKSINEGIKNWWSEASGNLYGSLAFYPILMVFLELDKVIKQLEGADMRSVIIYAIVWLCVITGKVTSGKLVPKNKRIKANSLKEV